MKGQACSWQDMRKIRAILADQDRLKGQYAALMRCGKKATHSRWRATARLMESVPISELRHVQPSHAQEIAVLAQEDTWRDWVQRCEVEQMTVLELRRALRQNRPVPQRLPGGRVIDLQDLINGRSTFGVIYVDPPWLYDNQATRAATGNHYAGLTVADLCALPVRELAAPDAHLHLWTTNGFLFECPKLFDAWGFEFKSSFVWVKTQLGIGNYWRNSHELLLTAVRGTATRFADKRLKSWLECSRGRHSSKPDQVREFIERASPAPRLELFGRRRVDGWTVWGDEVEML